MCLINKVYTAQDMRDAAKCLFACEVDLKHDNRDISRMLRQAADMIDRADGEEVLDAETLKAVVAAKRRIETDGNLSPSGNMSAMREALVRVKRLFDGRLMWQPDISKAHEAVDAALAKPPRNCDRPECATTKSAQDVWRKEDGGKTAYYEWLFAEAKGYEK